MCAYSDDCHGFSAAAPIRCHLNIVKPNLSTALLPSMAVPGHLSKPWHVSQSIIRHSKRHTRAHTTHGIPCSSVMIRRGRPPSNHADHITRGKLCLKGDRPNVKRVLKHLGHLPRENRKNRNGINMQRWRDRLTLGSPHRITV